MPSNAGPRSAAVIGDALVDVVGELRIPGGAALNVAVGLARLGIDTTLVAMIASDDDGRLLSAHAASNGVRVIATPAPLGSAAAIATPDGDSIAYEFNEAGLGRTIVLHAAAREAIDAADVVVVSCVALDDESQLADLIDAIRDPGARLVIDPNPRPGYLQADGARERFAAAVMRIGALARLVKLGDEDAALLFDDDVHASADHLLDAGAGAVLASLGADGATLHLPAERIHAPIHAMDSPIVDTIGAGDATLAVIAAALANAEPAGAMRADAWQHALERAMVVAAATCRVQGGVLQLPER